MLDSELSSESEVADSPRVPFAGSLGIASFDGQTPPDRQSFESVDGFNLSHAGISFETSEWPASDRLMVALGDDCSPALVSARVVACRKQMDQEASAPYEVRCEFDQWHT
ncbi:MAG: hypothetical protein QF918_10475 [Pirellulaceae bacterium]|jgi:hypothetical protein|nr:hypothetical protein [Pirellulaceae bacterium]MDP6555665.1 hypothetical protein [Pirellulaceae bacterium]MDP6720807.1 hypothetical protein [Pirellulaceae bacterium]